MVVATGDEVGERGGKYRGLLVGGADGNELGLKLGDFVELAVGETVGS